MSSRRTFMEACLTGRALPSDIDDYIDRWHESGGHHGQSLYSFLGMSREEYSRWVQHPESLRTAIAARRRGAASPESDEHTALLSFAARAEGKDGAEDVLRWLESTGKL